ncbi:MAG: hypothetical protein ABIT36_05145 [Steroidobacteraceae bacterium]
MSRNFPPWRRSRSSPYLLAWADMVVRAYEPGLVLPLDANE